MRAEADIARRVRHAVEAAGRFEPLALGLDQIHEQHRHVEHIGGAICEPVEARLARRVEDVQGLQIGKALGFVGEDGR
jgi:hypothetical protein